MSWQCRELGFGAERVALWLADRVASTGRVVAVDLDLRFLDGHGGANLEVRNNDVVTDSLGEAAFDLAHARAVLEHVPDRKRALEGMVSGICPGGWVVVEDLDFGAIMAAAVAHYADQLGNAALDEGIGRASEANGADVRFDSSFGGRLIKTFQDAGLVNIA